MKIMIDSLGWFTDERHREGWKMEKATYVCEIIEKNS